VTQKLDQISKIWPSSMQLQSSAGRDGDKSGQGLGTLSKLHIYADIRGAVATAGWLSKSSKQQNVWDLLRAELAWHNLDPVVIIHRQCHVTTAYSQITESSHHRL